MDLRTAVAILLTLYACISLSNAATKENEEATQNISSSNADATIKENTIYYPKITTTVSLQIHTENVTSVKDKKEQENGNSRNRNDLEPLKLEENLRDTTSVRNFGARIERKDMSSNEEDETSEKVKQKNNNVKENARNIRRQGDGRPLFGHRRLRPRYRQNVEFDDSMASSPLNDGSAAYQNEEVRNSPPSRNLANSRQLQNSGHVMLSERPQIHLTLGGYQRPFQDSNQLVHSHSATSTRNRDIVSNDEEKQTPDKPERNTRAFPHVSYSTQQEPVNVNGLYGFGPILHNPFSSPYSNYNPNVHINPQYSGIIPNNLPRDETANNPFLSYNNAFFTGVQATGANDYAQLLGGMGSGISTMNSNGLNGGSGIDAMSSIGRNAQYYPFHQQPNFNAAIPGQGFELNPYSSFGGIETVGNSPESELNPYTNSHPQYGRVIFTGENPPAINSPILFSRTPAPVDPNNLAIHAYPNIHNTLSPLYDQQLRYPSNFGGQLSNEDLRNKQIQGNDNQLNKEDQEKESESVSHEEKDPSSPAPFQSSSGRNGYTPQKADHTIRKSTLPRNSTRSNENSRVSSRVRHPPQFMDPEIAARFSRRQPYPAITPSPLSGPFFSQEFQPEKIQDVINSNSSANNLTQNRSFGVPPLNFNYPLLHTPGNRQNTEFLNYPSRSRNIQGIPQEPAFHNSPFFANPNLFHTENSPRLPSNYFGTGRSNDAIKKDEDEIEPTCARNTNMSICFEDVEYPRNQILYSLDTDSFLIQRFIAPSPNAHGFTEGDQEGNKNDREAVEERGVCTVKRKRGYPLRAKNAEGKWKVLVNFGKPTEVIRFSQPVSLEICSDTSQSCSYMENSVKTKCVQKYSTHHLLTWTYGTGIHMDVFTFPVACSCELIK